MPPTKSQPIVIVGAGLFGLTLAHELASRGYAHVTVLDRSLPPCPDGSSVDISRIVRSDYSSPLYTLMAKQALELWVRDYGDYFTNTEYCLVGDPKDRRYIDESRRQALANGIAVDEVPDAEDLKTMYPAIKSRFEGKLAVRNKIGGWANAQGAIGELARRCALAGVSFATGREGVVTELLQDGRAVKGVRTLSGRTLPADTVVLATGAWTNRIVPDLGHAVSAVGQPLVYLQLTPDEARSLEGMPIMMEYTLGIYCFPPSPGTNMLKLARHGYGWSSRFPAASDGDADAAASQGARVVSSPMRDGNNATSGFLPDDAVEAMREGVRMYFPQFADRPFCKMRMCWYTDTPEGDFLVDWDRRRDGLFIATGGSGHGFKMLPVLGRYTADVFEGKSPDWIRHLWRLRDADYEGQVKTMGGDGSRGGPPVRLLSPQEQAKL